jgi:hypothetical protein
VKNSFQILIFIVFLCASNSSSAFKVLFVGNSFTGFSQPILAQFALASPLGKDAFGFEFIGGTSLALHTSRVKTLNRIKNGEWDYVVLQDHSQQPIFFPDDFREAVTTLTAEVRASGAEPILFLTWARLSDGNYPSQQEIVSSGYEELGADLSITVTHVGDVFNDIRVRYPTLFPQLYKRDGIHATDLGLYAVASSIYRVMYDTDLEWAPGATVGSAAALVRDSAVRLNTPRAPHGNRFRIGRTAALNSIFIDLLLD